MNDHPSKPRRPGPRPRGDSVKLTDLGNTPFPRYVADPDEFWGDEPLDIVAGIAVDDECLYIARRKKGYSGILARPKNR